jgi:hypothetical protein
MRFDAPVQTVLRTTAKAVDESRVRTALPQGAVIRVAGIGPTPSRLRAPRLGTSVLTTVFTSASATQRRQAGQPSDRLASALPGPTGEPMLPLNDTPRGLGILLLRNLPV